MDPVYGRKGNQEGGAPPETAKANRNNPDRSGPMGETSREGWAERAIRHNRKIGGGFFVEEGEAVCELLVQQLIDSVRKSLENAEACIDWYEKERSQYQEQLDRLQAILEAARDERLQQQAKEEEE